MISQLTYENPPDKDKGATILILDDELGVRLHSESICLKLDGSLRILQAETVPQALEILSSTPVHVLLLDKNLGTDEDSPNGIEAIPDILQLQPYLQILVVTGSKKLDDVVYAMRLGAGGYVIKGLSDDLFVAQVKRALHVADLALEKARAEKSNHPQEEYEFVGSSPVIRNLFDQAKAYAESNRPVLLTGESGTGKSITAKLVHESRTKFLREKDRPFIKVIISALPSSLVEAELFGSVEGAFTDAKKPRVGYIELANCGTLFLDEIAEIPPSVQAALLGVLDDGEFSRVGSSTKLKSSFKLICATNKDLEQMVKQGTFSEALYYRIRTFTIRIPALEERKDDIPDIVRAVLPKCCRENNVFISFEDIPTDVIDFLKENIPPGNIRGIEDQISRLLVLSPKDKQGIPQFKNWRSIPGFQPTSHNGKVNSTRSAITLKELMTLPLNIVSPEFPGLSEVTESIEHRILLEAKNHFHGKNRKIARFLKLSDSTTSTRLKNLHNHASPSPIKSSQPEVLQ